MLNFHTSDKDESSDFLPPSPKYSEHKPKEYFLGIAKKIKDENESERAHLNAQTIVQMCRRHRNMSPGDAFGYWRGGIWCEAPGFSSLHNVPIFQQLVVGAQSNFAQADIRLSIESNSHTFPNRSVEKISTDIYEILNERQWAETQRDLAFFAAILMNNAYYISRFNKDKGDDVPVPKFDDVSYDLGGVAVCTECYNQAEPDAEMCDKCGNDSFSIIDEPQTVEDQIVSMFELGKAGETEMVIADGLDVSVDPNGRPADVTSCRWVEWRQQAQKDEVQRLYPHLKCESRPEWSYQTRLKKGLKRYESGETGITTDADKTEYEIRHIWLDKTEYEGYCAPEDWKLGKDVVLKRGEHAKEVWPDGIALGIIGQEIAYIDNEDKNKRVASSLWISDGVGFEGLGAKAGLAIQRKINQLENIAMEGETRSLKGSLIYNPNAIDGAHLEGANTNVPLKPDFSTTEPLSNFAMPLSVEGLSQHTLLYMDRQKQTMQEVMGIPDVILGQDTSTDKTFGGQALRSRNALGLLTPKTQSTARAKECWLMHQLDIIQTYYSADALRQFGSRSGNEWTDEEIQAFLDADLEKSITVSYIPGTEIPESRFEKQLRLRQDIAAGFVPITPKLMSQLAQESNYDAPDVGNFMSNLKLAEKRFKFIQDTVEQTGMDQIFIQVEAQMIDPATGMRATDQMGQPVPNPLIMQFMQAPELVIYDFEEDHLQMAEYWSDKVRELAGASKVTSPTLLAMCDGMVRRHNQSTFTRGMIEQGMQGTVEAAAQAPGQIGQKMLEGEQEDPQAAEGRSHEAEGQKMAATQAHEREMKEIDVDEREKDRKHDMEKAKLQAKQKAQTVKK